MKAATGNATLMNIIIIFLVVVLGMLVASITYTKAFRVKNRIIDIIEQYDGDFVNHKDDIKGKITDTLSRSGHSLKGTSSCGSLKDGTTVYEDGKDYYYCIYKYDTSRGYYYKVVSYMSVDVMGLGSPVNIPVYGETKVFYE